MAHKAALKIEEPEREKARAPKKKKTAKKKKSSKRRYSESAESRASTASVREARHASDDRQWREFKSSRYE